MKRLFFCLLMVSSSFLFAQKAMDEDKEQLTPYYDFKKGVGITTPDSLFQMNIRFRMQNRFDAVVDKNDEVGYEAYIRRLRLRFEGFVIDPKFGYTIQLSFAPRDVNGNHIIRDAIVFYKPNKNWLFSFGQTKLPGNRQRINSSGALQLTDRSINNATFNIDRDFGFQAHYLNQRNDKFSYNLKTAVTMGEGRDFIGRNTGLAYTARFEILPLGKFKKGGEYFEGDILREETPKLYFGATYHYNHNATKTQGQNGNTLANEQKRNLQSVLVDGLMKYNGWAIMASYMQRTANNPLIDLRAKSFVEAGRGFDAQLSYAFPSNWEIASRYSHLSPINDIKDVMPKRNQISLGVTKYIWEHAFKAQMEITRTNKMLLDSSQKEWYLRFQVEIGI
ncbi:porin [Capnocytophaga cynodegmi]|uniref:porin n=1 Tax=Capnocytophaga cynodegmi TaxID=28189 RepID=UPI00385C306F